jgi:uncharacterized protein (DUF1330 family)
VPKAYIISDVSLKDEDAAHAYRELAAASIEPRGRRYAVRGGKISVLEGEWRPRSSSSQNFQAETRQNAGTVA